MAGIMLALAAMAPVCGVAIDAKGYGARRRLGASKTAALAIASHGSHNCVQY